MEHLAAFGNKCRDAVIRFFSNDALLKRVVSITWFLVTMLGLVMDLYHYLAVAKVAPVGAYIPFIWMVK